MLILVLNVVYVLVAIAMITLILLQRGAGAAAGSGFGAGASGTVFGARGASNFLSKSTKWLAIVFFGIALFMAWYANHNSRPEVQMDQSLQQMSQQVPALPEPTPAPGELIPVTVGQQNAVAVPSSQDAPASQEPATVPAPTAEQPQQPAPPQ
ncbi:MAG: preprotein translocase subunit SecG [Xanthomonadaceae bacterium]|jgi:preprotein translocase subunit SecG|nr:preprotein translocase subunit SecG [Xanthomonadaceae bacterium]